MTRKGNVYAHAQLAFIEVTTAKLRIYSSAHARLYKDSSVQSIVLLLSNADA